MNELQLRDFGGRVEELVTPPEFSALDDRGRALRHKRVGAVAALAACVLALAALTVLRDDPAREISPTRPTDRADVDSRPYPGNLMRTLAPGTYEITPSWTTSHPRARVTVPAGWNSWEGPNRFDGHAPGRTNEEALQHATWYVGLLVLEVDAVPSEPCGWPAREVGSSAAGLARAVGRIPGYRTTREPESRATFGYPATHFRLRPTAALLGCEGSASLFDTDRNGVIGAPEDPADVWVLDVEGDPLAVVATSTANAPDRARRQLTAVVDSLEVTTPG
jgi:hypothetical protein